MSDSIDLDAIQKRADAATPGPWWRGDTDSFRTDCVFYQRGDGACVIVVGNPNFFEEFLPSLDFIAAARADIPDLIAHARAETAARQAEAAVSEGRLKILNAKADEADAEWRRAEQAEERARAETERADKAEREANDGVVAGARLFAAANALSTLVRATERGDGYDAAVRGAVDALISAVASSTLIVDGELIVTKVGPCIYCREAVMPQVGDGVTLSAAGLVWREHNKTCAESPTRIAEARIRLLESALTEARGRLVHDAGCSAPHGYTCRCGLPECLAAIDAALRGGK